MPRAMVPKSDSETKAGCQIKNARQKGLLVLILNAYTLFVGYVLHCDNTGQA